MSQSLSKLDDHPLAMDAIQDAAEALLGVVACTPLLENPDTNEELGGRLLIKCEQVQRTGAFKIRGAYNRLRLMDWSEKKRGVISYSSGNHALGLAVAARLTGSSAMIVMPSDAPGSKIKGVKALGAQVATYDRDTENYNEVVERLSEETGRIVVPPSGDVRVLAGTGTAALEMLQQAEAQDTELDAVLVPCGSGGLTAATAFVMHELSPATQVYAVEPDLFDDTRRSLEAGERVANPVGLRTICDAIMTPTPNEYTFEINRRLLAGGLVASDDDVLTAMRFAFAKFKMVIEPGAAVGLAAVLNGQIDIRGRTIGVFITGGNIDATRYSEFLNG